MAAGVQSVLSEGSAIRFATPILVVIAIVVLYLLNSIKILREYERGVIFRLGRALPVPKGPGVILVFARLTRWFASRCARMSSKFRRRM